MTDARGFTTRLEYDLFNRPIAATDPLGGRTRSLYDVAGQLVASVNELGQADYAKFDKRGRAVLQLSADPDGAGPQLPSATRLVYNDAHLIETIDPLGHSTTYEYDRLGRLLNETSVASVDPVVVLATSQYGYDANGNLTTVTDPLNRVTTYLYDELNRRTKITEPVPETNGPNGSPLLSPQTTTNYDGYGNVKSVVEHRGGSTSQRTTRYRYDARNRRTEEIFDAGIDGTSGVNYLNQRTAFAYDDVGNLEFKREYVENAAAPTGFDLLRTTEYAYDKLGRRIRETLNSDGTSSAAPTEQITLTTYDAVGNIQTQTENAEVGSGVAALTTVYIYDAANRVTRELLVGSSQVRTTRYKHDAAGNLLSVVDPLGRLSRSEYDRLGRLVKSIAPDPDGDDPIASETTSFTYDAAGNLRTETNGAGEVKRYAYDPQGRLIESIDGRNDKTTRRYDKVGNLIELTDPALNATTYVYDNLDRLQFETTSSGSREWVYDARGDVAITVDRNGRAIRYAYDRDGQMKQSWDYATRADAAASNNNYVAFVNVYYDGLRRLAEQASTQRVAYGNWTTAYRVTDSYVLDGLDRVVQRSNQSQYPATPAHSTGVPAIETTYAYAYEASGQVVTRNQFIAGQFAAETRSTYNAFGELVRQEDKETSSASVPSTILDFESTDAVFSYLGDGSLASTTRYTDWDDTPLASGHRNRIQTNYAYDGAGQLKSIAHGQARRTAAANGWPGNTPLVDFAYGYDAAGRINSIGTNWNTTLAGLTTRYDETQAFDYDDAGQLVSAGYEGFSYGPNGNRTFAWEELVGANEYETGDNNQIDQDTYFTYEYDDEGNLIRRNGVTTDYYQLYMWDHRNRLVKLEKRDSTGLLETIAYRYNASDELVYRSLTPAGQSAQVEHYLVASGQRTLAFESDGDVKRRYLYGPTGDILFDQVFDHTVTTLLQGEQDLYVPLGDHQHTPRVVLAHAGDDSTYVRQSHDVSPFGRESAPLGANGQPDYAGRVVAHGFQGMVYDVDARLYRTAARVYDPHLGRFISEDPIQDGANWYMFAGNAPVNYADPSGLAMQGHPLAGGYSGNKTTAPAIPSGNLFGGAPLSSSTNNFLKGAVNQAINPSSFPSTTFGGFVNASLGNSILSGGFGPSPAFVGSIASYQTATYNNYASSLSGTTFPSLTIGDFTYANSLSGLTRTVDPLTSMITQSQQARAHWQEVERQSQVIVSVEQLNSGDPVKAMGWLGYALPSVAPSYRVTYGDGRSVIQLGGEPNTSEAITIPGVGTAAIKTARPVVNAAREVAPTALGKVKGVLDDALQYVKDKIGLSRNTPEGPRVIEQPYQQQQARASQIDRKAFKTEREAFWKREAAANAERYTPQDLEKMKQGRAPTGPDGHPMELHHVDRTPTGGLQPMSRTDHRLGENYKKNHHSKVDHEH